MTCPTCGAVPERRWTTTTVAPGAIVGTLQPVCACGWRGEAWELTVPIGETTAAVKVPTDAAGGNGLPAGRG